MKKIALTGNLGSGKSTVGRMFEKLGAIVVDADELIKTFYRREHPVHRKVVSAFGRSILDAEGNIDRKKLADLVFSDHRKLELLEEITHRALYEELERIYSRIPENSLIFVEASLLIAPYEICKRRAIERGFSEEDFERRWRRQMPPEEKIKFGDFVIDNSGPLSETERQVRDVFEAIRREAGRNRVVIVDEVGKMELFSKQFRDLVGRIVRDPGLNVVVTIPLRDVHPLVREIRRLPSAVLIELTRTNREGMAEEILSLLSGDL